MFGSKIAKEKIDFPQIVRQYQDYCLIFIFVSFIVLQLEIAIEY